MKKLVLLSILILTVSACTNSTKELMAHFEALERSNVRVGVLDLFEQRDVRRLINPSVELSLYQKCATFFSANPDLGSLKDSLVYEEFLKLAMSNSDALLGPFLGFIESGDRYSLSAIAQSLIWSSAEEQQIATLILKDYQGSPERMEAKAYILTNQDSPKFKPLGICMAQEMFVTLFNEETPSSDALLEISQDITHGMNN